MHQVDYERCKLINRNWVSTTFKQGRTYLTIRSQTFGNEVKLSTRGADWSTRICALITSTIYLHLCKPHYVNRTKWSDLDFVTVNWIQLHRNQTKPTMTLWPQCMRRSKYPHYKTSFSLSPSHSSYHTLQLTYSQPIQYFSLLISTNIQYAHLLTLLASLSPPPPPFNRRRCSSRLLPILLRMWICRICILLQRLPYRIRGLGSLTAKFGRMSRESGRKLGARCEVSLSSSSSYLFLFWGRWRKETYRYGWFNIVINSQDSKDLRLWDEKVEMIRPNGNYLFIYSLGGMEQKDG